MTKQSSTGMDAESEASMPDDDQRDSTVFGALAGGAWKLATKGPSLAMDIARIGASEAERHALLALKKRLLAASEESQDGADCTGESSTGVQAKDAWLGEPGKGPSPVAIMSELLESALEQTPDQARERLMQRFIRQLVPDEARILSSLSDGRSSTLVYLAAGPKVGVATQRWLDNLSSIGREAGVQLNDQVSYYIANLKSMGLVEIGPEDKSLKLKYELIEADFPVRECISEIEAQGMRPKFHRRTLRLSDPGMAFWKWCQGDESDDAL